MFTQAIRRTLQDVQAQVQAVLKEKFTPIHPSVEWKFRAAALQYVRTREIKDVVFPDVYSLYSASDIRSSSEMRNRAIQTDLIRQVETAKAVLEGAQQRREIEYLSSLIYRLERLIAELEILAQAEPIALRFSQEEKKFNVDEVSFLSCLDSPQAHSAPRAGAGLRIPTGLRFSTALKLGFRRRNP